MSGGSRTFAALAEPYGIEYSKVIDVSSN